MSPTPRRPPITEAADALVAVAPLVNRWTERLLAAHEPPLTVTQFVALRAIAGEGVSGAELARRAGVSGPAVSQLLAGLVDAGMLERGAFAGDRRRQTLALSATGRATLESAQSTLRERLGALLSELPPREAHALAHALPEVEAVLSGAPPPRRPPPPPPRGPGRGPRHRAGG
jgi:DNA-binding MarR family transcriptional regulator